MDRNGTRIAEDSVAGRMLARTARGDTLLFADPGAAARLNKLIVR
jgi:hypothetical protein